MESTEEAEALRCPECGSADVEVRHDERASEWMEGASVPRGVLLARCHGCGNVHFPDPSNLWVH
jgi:uncharacterized Zn finger protein